ncbi:MAG: efflux RND transporter periplasmic adaptor subunit [Betaproteobacteria bacterium]|nr:efflux RND transporter periplasmic adaptor subunit [Betaproteobacteria bacterium]
MKRYVTYAVVITGLAGLGGWAYYTQHAPARPALEIGATSSTASKAPASAQGAGSAPAGSATTPSAAGGAGGARPAGGAAGGGRGPVGVEAERAQPMAITEEVFAVGNLRANESVTIRPEIAGRVVRIGFTEGALVRKGDLLVELDRSVLLAQVEQARAELDLSKANYDRTADLAERKFVSESAKDQAAANLSVQQAKLRLAEAQLAKTQIFAPFNGVVGLRNFSVGDYVREAADLVVLEDVSQMKVDLRLPERFLGELKPGLSVEMRVDAYPQRVFRAALLALDVQVSADGRALVARGMLANQEFLLRSGMFARARIVLKERGSAVMVPEEAVYPMGADIYVYKIIDGKAMRTKVATGVRRDGKVEITEGVAVGELVVTAGQIKLARDGTEVRVQGAGGGARGGGAAGGGAASDGSGQGSAPKGPAPRPAG